MMTAYWILLTDIQGESLPRFFPHDGQDGAIFGHLTGWSECCNEADYTASGESGAPLRRVQLRSTTAR
jgi:hypothetical protein